MRRWRFHKAREARALSFSSYGVHLSIFSCILSWRKHGGFVTSQKKNECWFIFIKDSSHEKKFRIKYSESDIIRKFYLSSSFCSLKWCINPSSSSLIICTIHITSIWKVDKKYPHILNHFNCLHRSLYDAQSHYADCYLYVWCTSKCSVIPIYVKTVIWSENLYCSLDSTVTKNPMCCNSRNQLV